jgi:hypothetical protein
MKVGQGGARHPIATKTALHRLCCDFAYAFAAGGPCHEPRPFDHRRGSCRRLPGALDLLGRITRANSEILLCLLDAIPECQRARLAVWLYGRSHTHATGVRIATTCEGSSLRREAGLVGDKLHDLSKKPYAVPTYGMARLSTSRRPISLGGS